LIAALRRAFEAAGVRFIDGDIDAVAVAPPSLRHHCALRAALITRGQP
jgi:hypothetical protein